MLLTCHCLNFKLQTSQELIFTSRSLTDITGLPKDCQCEFFQKNLDELELRDHGSLSQEHSYLFHKQQVGDWVLYRCLNCGIDTHAVSTSRQPKVLVSDLLQTDSLVIERLHKSPDYSQVFGIVMTTPETDLHSGSMPDSSSRNYESLQSQLNNIQQHLSSFLLQEEATMEEKIRTYEEEERQRFQILQNRVRSDKKKMISLLLTAAEDVGVGSSQTGSEGSGDVRGLDRKSKDGSPHDRSVTAHGSKQTATRTKSTPVPKIRSISEYQENPDSEAMFMLDDDDDNDDPEPFYSSDEEDETEDDSPVVSRTSPMKHSIYSSSMPISVPIWNKSGVYAAALDAEKLTPSDPDQIAASMQALAQSITTDERYIFGERPRPRLNTGDSQRPTLNKERFQK